MPPLVGSKSRSRPARILDSRPRRGGAVGGFARPWTHRRTSTESRKIMFAIFEDGSHQYRVKQGETVAVAYRVDAKAGDTIVFDNVLLANGGDASSVGTPSIKGATVKAEVVNAELKGPKLEIGKLRRRKNFRRHTGHRQRYTSVKVTAIDVPGLKIKAKETAGATE
ncbi:MAG: 50S ribosomal protein L21 [Planctomycetaceae bacterium]